ncbi:MAG: peptidylprolyl isomerase, partial [Robiginitalea sp.]
MICKQPLLCLMIGVSLLTSCREQRNEKAAKEDSEAVPTDTLAKASGQEETTGETTEESFVLTEENAIDFFFSYQKDLKVNKVRLTTSMGSFTVQLYDNVPYHKANFIYLTRRKYFDNTMFHRVVRD